MSRPASTPIGRRSVLASALALPALVAGVGASTAPRAKGAPQPERPLGRVAEATPLDPIRPKINDYEAWPHLLSTPGGAVLCGYTARIQHLNVDGSASVVVRSTDGGRSWESIAVHRKDGVGWGFEAGTTGADGRIITLHSRNDSLEHDDPAEVLVEFSDDDGKTFAEGASFPSEGRFATIGDLTYVGGRTLLAPWHGDGWGVLRTEDNGATWTIEGKGNGGEWPREGRIIASEQGLLMIGRSPDGLLLLRSTDTGSTWTQAEQTGLGVRYEGMHVDGETVHLVLADRETGKITRTASTASRLFADATDWDEQVHIADLDPSGAPAEQGYPDLAPIGTEGTMLMAAYDGENPVTDIRLWEVPA